jgi:ligand-binding sensor domain-containing protein/signal transduction histidine kinase
MKLFGRAHRNPRSAFPSLRWKRLFIVVWIALILIPYGASAQINTIRFETVSVEEGLSQNAVLAIAQDAQGFLWFGTEDGLNKYDGYQFTVFEHDPEDPESIIDNYVSEIFVDCEGEIWIGTRSGLDRYKRQTNSFTHYPSGTDEASGLLGTWVISIFEDRQGALWIGTEEGGLSRYDRGSDSFTHFQREGFVPTSVSENAVRVIYEDRQGHLWIATHLGLDRFDRARERFVRYEPDPSNPSREGFIDISAISEDDEGRLWLGTEDNGLYRLDARSDDLVHFAHDPDDPNSLSHDRVRAIMFDHIGQLWVGTQNGLNLLLPDQVANAGSDVSFQRFQHDPFDPTSLSGDAVWSIYEDRGGVLWFGTWGGGLSKYNRSTDHFRLYQHRPYQLNSLSDNMIWAIEQDRQGRLWIGTFNGGLNRVDRATDTIIVYEHDDDEPDSLLNNDVRTVLEDSTRRLWVGTAGGLDLYQPGSDTFEHFTHDPRNSQTLSGPRVNVLLESRTGEIWVGTRYSGLNRFDPDTKEFTHYRHSLYDPKSLSDDRIWALYEDREGALWVGTLSGINLLEPGSDEFIRYQHDPDVPDSLSENAVFAFAEDLSGNLWVGTWGGGLERFDPELERFLHYTEREGLPNNTIYGIEVDADGNLWMSTNRGLSRFDPERESFRNFDVQDGLQDNEFNVGAHAKGERGELFFGGIRGFNAFFPSEVQRNEHVPPVVITTVYKFNQPVYHDLLPDAHIDLSYKDSFVAFEFSALDYYAPENNRYAYMLEGFDEDWVEAGTRRYVSYTNLDGGAYVFRVRGSNSDGVWNEAGASLSLTVEPPFWETLWFRGGIMLLIVLMGVTGFRLRIHAVEARSRELESLVQQRTNEIEQRRDELDALYRADEELLRSLDLEQVFLTLVGIAVDILHADKGALFFWEEREQEWVALAARGFKTESKHKLTDWVDEHAMASILETGQPMIVNDASDDARIEKGIVDQEGICSFMHIPITIRDRIYGVLNVDYLEPRTFGPEEQRLIQALAQRAALAIEQAQLHEQAQKSAVFEERQRLARDLHDAVTQTLFSASLIADVLPMLWEKDIELGRQRLETLRELTRGALAEMRSLLIELRPSAISEAELRDLLRQLSESITGRARIPVELQIEGEADLDPNEKVALYRIAQEALNNVAKHAVATRIWIRLSCDQEGILFKIEDDGVGFDPEHVEADQLGLGIMRERAQSIGASLIIESEQGRGTRLTLALPDRGKTSS